MGLPAALIKSGEQVYALFDFAHICLQYFCIDAQVAFRIGGAERIAAIATFLLVQVAKQQQRVGIEVAGNGAEMLPFRLPSLRVGIQVDGIQACQQPELALKLD